MIDCPTCRGSGQIPTRHAYRANCGRCGADTEIEDLRLDAIPELGQNCNEANYPEVTVSEHHKEMFRCPYCDHITVLMFIPELNLYECDNCHVGFDEREAEMMTGEFAKASGRK